MSRSTIGGRSFGNRCQIIIGDIGWTIRGALLTALAIHRSWWDSVTGTIWCSRLWSSRQAVDVGRVPAPESRARRKQGNPQLVHKSSDDGRVTWSDPINITTTIQDTRPEWWPALQGPAKGSRCTMGRWCSAHTRLAQRTQTLNRESGLPLRRSCSAVIGAKTWSFGRWSPTMITTEGSGDPSGPTDTLMLPGLILASLNSQRIKRVRDECVRN